jgi:glutaredoxin
MDRKNLARSIFSGVILFGSSALVAWFAVGAIRDPARFGPDYEEGDWREVIGDDRLPPIVLYSMPDCQACRSMKTFLAQECVVVVERPLNNSSINREQFAKLGEESVPVLIVEERKFVGFSPDALRRSLDWTELEKDCSRNGI